MQMVKSTFSRRDRLCKIKRMKRNQILMFTGILALILFIAACSSAPQQAQTSNANSAVVTRTDANSPVIASSHGTAQTAPTPPSNNDTGKSTSSSAPMMSGNARAIDTSEFDAEIAKAEKEYKRRSKDEKAKNDLADTYAKRAFALTEAAQYRAALGDFRKSLKLNPDNEEAKRMHDEIIRIFTSLNREPPKEGEEPPPLPFKKGA